MEGYVSPIDRRWKLYCRNGHRLSETRVLTSTGVSKGCGICLKARTAVWQKANAESENAKSAKWRRENPEAFRRSSRNSILKRKYGLDILEYERLLKKQDFVCAICKREEPRKGSALSVDHCHKTGKVRGLLCTKCNTAIGLLNESPGLFKAALGYLKKHSLFELWYLHENPNNS